MLQNIPRQWRVVIIIMLAIIVGVPLVTGVAFYLYVNDLRTESIRQETGLNAQYLANQNYLSAFISGFYEQIGIADRKSERLEGILTEAIKGRYDSGGFSAKGAFFSAVVEAYPQLGTLNTYDRVVGYVAAQREGYRATQDKLYDMLRRYDAWREEGYVRSWMVANAVGIPSRRLQARLGSEISYGETARNQMYRIVLAAQATDAYATGRMEPLMRPTDRKK